MLQLFCIRIALPVMLLSATTLYAQTTRQDDGSQALKRMQFMLQQLTREKALLEEEKLQLGKNVELLESDLAKAAKKTAEQEQLILRHEQNAEALNGNIDGLNTRIKTREQQLRDLAEKYKDTTLLVRMQNMEMEKLQATISDKEFEINHIEQKNLDLYEANIELLEIYSSKDMLDALLQKDAVTGLKQVQIENILQEYRLRLLDSKVPEVKKQ